MRKIKYKLNKWGDSVTKCPHGLRTFRGAPKVVGYHCLGCQYRKHIDFGNQVVECDYARKKDKV